MKPEELAALRHLVYAELIGQLPPASLDQTDRFASNLALLRFQMSLSDSRAKQETAKKKLFSRFLLLRVSPDVSEVQASRDVPDIEAAIYRRFGDRLELVPGFYRHTASGRVKVNLPTACALHGYRSRLRFYAGVLCQPLYQIDKYFLLSSAHLGGQKAVRMEYKDQQFYSQFEERPADLARSRN